MLELNEDIKILPILKRSVLGCAFKAACDAKQISESHCIQYIAIMYATGASEDLIVNIIEVSLAMYPSSTALWESLMKYYIQCKDDKKVEEVFRNAKRKLGNECDAIWNLYMQYLLVKTDASHKIKEFFQEVVKQPHANFRSLKVDCIESTAVLFGVNNARKFFNNTIKNGFPCLEMYNKIAEIEELQVK